MRDDLLSAVGGLEALLRTPVLSQGHADARAVIVADLTGALIHAGRLAEFRERIEAARAHYARSCRDAGVVPTLADLPEERKP